MNTLSRMATMAACAGLAACSSATTPTTPAAPTPVNIGGQAAHVGTTYSATQAGVVTDITATKILQNGQPFWINSTAGTRIAGYDSANVLAIGGFNNGTTSLIKGLTGLLSSPPQTGTATYTGRYAVAKGTTIASAPLTMDVNFNTGTFQDTSYGVSVSGTITGQQFTGTFSHSGASVPLEGGFFGTNEMAGVFGNSTIAGVIYGSKP